MIAERKFERLGVRQCLDRLNTHRGIIDPCLRLGGIQMDRHAVFATQAFIPYDQLERAVTAFKQQVMNSVWLVDDLVVELSQIGEGALVRQDSRQIVQVKRGEARGVVGSIETERLITGFVSPVSQKVNRGIGVAALVLREI